MSKFMLVRPCVLVCAALVGTDATRMGSAWIREAAVEAELAAQTAPLQAEAELAEMKAAANEAAASQAATGAVATEVLAAAAASAAAGVQGQGASTRPVSLAARRPVGAAVAQQAPAEEKASLAAGAGEGDEASQAGGAMAALGRVRAATAAGAHGATLWVATHAGTRFDPFPGAVAWLMITVLLGAAMYAVHLARRPAPLAGARNDMFVYKRNLAGGAKEGSPHMPSRRAQQKWSHLRDRWIASISNSMSAPPSVAQAPGASPIAEGSQVRHRGTEGSEMHITASMTHFVDDIAKVGAASVAAVAAPPASVAATAAAAAPPAPAAAAQPLTPGGASLAAEEPSQVAASLAPPAPMVPPPSAEPVTVGAS